MYGLCRLIGGGLTGPLVIAVIGVVLLGGGAANRRRRLSAAAVTANA